MKYQIMYTSRFQKHLKTLTSQEQKLVHKKLDLLAENPLHPSLRVKRIQNSDGLFECSVNMDIRVIWYLEGAILIVALDVGHHDILKQF